MTPIEEMKIERVRQKTVEGWTNEHDDTHGSGEMLRAAVIYFQHAARKEYPLAFREDGAPMGWPWEAEWWKPKDDRRDLVRAGALCLAEKDRILRLCERTGVSVATRWPPVDHKLRLIVEALNLLNVNSSTQGKD